MDTDMIATDSRLHEARKQLAAAYEELRDQGRLANSTQDYDLGHLVAAIERAREVRDEFKLELKGYSIQLDDGREIFPHQYEALNVFAANNSLDVQKLWQGVIIKDRRIVTAEFRDLGITTLEGLDEIHSLKELDVMDSPLTSLKGIPTGEIEVIRAFHCDLRGDLSVLQSAKRLKVLIVQNNFNLASCEGVPTDSLEVFAAGWCDLRGDLTPLSQAMNLRHLEVWGNRSLKSLSEIPLGRVERVDASGCSLSGNLTFLSRAPRLTSLNLQDNWQITLDLTQFDPRVKIYV
jgi:hypothetical protein